MRLIISGDINESSGLVKVITDLSGSTERRFLDKNYGAGIASIVIILMCHEPSLVLKRRIRFTKKDKMLGFDMMLDFNEMKRLDHAARKQRVVELILADAPIILDKYSIPDFDKVRFMEDFTSWLKNHS